MTTVTLTVVYDSSGTWDFSSTDSSVTGVSGTAITVTDGTNYNYYAPATDTLGTSLSGGTWQTVQKLGNYDSNGDVVINGDSTDGYIYTSDSAYINSGYYPNINTGITLQYKTTSDVPSASTFYCIFGEQSSSNDNAFKFYAYRSGASGFNFRVSSVSFSNFGSGDYITKATGSASSITFTNDGQTQSFTPSSTPSSFIASNYGYIFANNLAGSAMYNANYINLYSLKLSDSTGTVRDYIPIVYGSTYALYDKSFIDNGNTKVIYDNDGTGTFSGGGTQSALTYTHTVQDYPTVSVFNATSDTWVDGTPYVFNGTSWVQASKVYVYVNGSWVEKT